MGAHDQVVVHDEDAHQSIHDDGRTLANVELGAGAGANDPDNPDIYKNTLVFRLAHDKLLAETLHVRLRAFHVTEWESLYSNVFALGRSNFSVASFTPLVDGSCRVIGHLGWADGNDILVPEDTVRNGRQFWSLLQKQRLGELRQWFLDDADRWDRGPFPNSPFQLHRATTSPPPPAKLGNCVYYPPGGISLGPTIWDQARRGPLPENTEPIALTYQNNLVDFVKGGGKAFVGRHFQRPGDASYLNPYPHPLDGKIGSPKKPFSSGYEFQVLVDPEGNLQGVMEIRNNLKTEDEWVIETALEAVDIAMTVWMVLDVFPIAVVLLRLGVKVATGAAIRAIRLVLDAAAKAALERLEQETKRLAEAAAKKAAEEALAKAAAEKAAKEFAVEEIEIDAKTQARWEARGARLNFGKPGKVHQPGKHTRAVGELWRDGAAAPEKFTTKSGQIPKDFPEAEEDLTLTHPPRHVTKPEPIEGFNKGIPEHLKDATPAEKREWLKSPEGFQWQKTHKLDGPFTNLETKPPHSGPRDHDAEAIMFTEVEQKTTAKTVGEFHFKADHPVCPACRDLVFRFRQSRPGIGVIQHSPDTLPGT